MVGTGSGAIVAAYSALGKVLARQMREGLPRPLQKLRALEYERLEGAMQGLQNFSSRYVLPDCWRGGELGGYCALVGPHR